MDQTSDSVSRRSASYVYLQYQFSGGGEEQDLGELPRAAIIVPMKPTGNITQASSGYFV